MIELIFALVILGITLMSAPLLVSQATTSSTVAFQQESIAMIASHTAALMTYQWDENNTIPDANPNRDILRVPASPDTDTELDDQNFTNFLRAPLATFTISTARKRRISRQGVAVPPAVPAPPSFATAILGQDMNDNDDIDDYSGTNLQTSAASTATNFANTGEYMDTTINIATAITYADDRSIYNAGIVNRPLLAAVVRRTQIKSITTNLTSVQLPNKQIRLQAFMCNIGANPNLLIGNF